MYHSISSIFIEYLLKCIFFLQQRPLTRYLPIKSTEPSSLQFNLRQHIQANGHQLELYSTVLLTGTSCRGYLYKMAGYNRNKMDVNGANGSQSGSKSGGRLFGKTYKKRWFVFDRAERALVYYADKSEAKARGFIYFEVRWCNCLVRLKFKFRIYTIQYEN